jgi:phosphoribosylformylglycinamidine synthase
MFSESNSRFVCEVPAAEQAAFESAMGSVPWSRLGQVTQRPRLVIRESDAGSQIDADIRELKEAWQAPLRW